MSAILELKTGRSGLTGPTDQRPSESLVVTLPRRQLTITIVDANKSV